jgi:hypothetical protein
VIFPLFWLGYRAYWQARGSSARGSSMRSGGPRSARRSGLSHAGQGLLLLLEILGHELRALDRELLDLAVL